MVIFTGHKNNYRDSAFWKEADVSGYDAFTVLLLVVVVEHAFIFIKAAMVGLITDVPEKIVRSEAERPAAEKRAIERLDEIKEEKDA